MNLLQRIAKALGGILLVALLLAALAPKTAHGIVAALVQVANTAANPAIVSNLDDPGRAPYQATATQPSNCQFRPQCFWSFGPVPPGHRLVIQRVSITAQYTTAPASATVQVEAPLGNVLNAFTVVPVVDGSFKGTINQPVLVYVDGGLSIEIFETPQSVFQFNSAQTATLTGYLLDCNVAPCAPIVTQ